MSDNPSNLLKAGVGEDASWQFASKIVKSLGPVAANFASTVRTLLVHYQSGEPTLPRGARTQLQRLLTNGTIKANYYFATKAYRPELLPEGRKLQPRDLLTMYSPYEHAILLSICYLFRFLNRKCDPSEWDFVTAPLYESLEVGACIGKHVPEAGFAAGILGASARYFGLAPLLIANQNMFKEYRRYLKKNDLPYDTAQEISLWGCTSIQVAALLFESIGFAGKAAQQLVAASEHSRSTAIDPLYGEQFRIVEAILSSFNSEGLLPTTLPDWTHSQLAINSERRAELTSELRKAISNANRIEWLEMNTASLTPERAPHFFPSANLNDSPA